MPQVWNPSVTDQDSGGFSKNSRYMKLNNFSVQALRRIKARNALEARFNNMQQAYIERKTARSSLLIDQSKRDLLERQTRLRAYKLVVTRRHPIRKRADYQAALNDNYSLHALRHEIRRMIHDIDPDTIRRRKAAQLVESSRDKYAETVVRNKEAIGDLVPKPKPVVLEEKPETPRTPTPPPQPRLRRSIVGPPMRTLAREAQAVTMKMVKENTWMSRGNTNSPDKPVQTSKNLNPNAVLPPINA
ncbi:hypothetical protein BaRGS_00005384 [Batillaria attramentaria]|uniref:Uncharacterized protein n=1 Tax=Batillaria attramentaria TaxID=370345 RepID=A0ABD0LWI1_9CAEN